MTEHYSCGGNVAYLKDSRQSEVAGCSYTKLNLAPVTRAKVTACRGGTFCLTVSKQLAKFQII